MDKIGEFIRPLGATEEFTDACQVHRNLTLVYAISLSTEKDFTFSQLEEALRRLQSRHIQLGACIKRNKKRLPSSILNPIKWFSAPTEVPQPAYWTIPNPIIPLQWIVMHKLDWRKGIFENEVQATFEEGSLLWRAYWVDRTAQEKKERGRVGTFIWMSHASIGDVQGASYLMEDFLTEFSGVLNGHSPSISKDEAKMQDKIESLMDPKYEQFTWKETFQLWKFFANCLSPWKSSLITKFPSPIVPDFTTRLIQFNISSFSKALLKLSRDKGISIQALWTAAGLAALHEIVSLGEGQTLNVRTTHEANMRIHCKNYAETKGRIYGVMCTYTEDPLETKRVKNKEEFWNLAYQCHTALTKSLNSEFLGKMVLFFGRSGCPYQMFSNLGLTTKARNDFAVQVHELDSNMKHKQGIQIEEIFATSSAFSMGCPLKHTVNLIEDDLSYNLFYYGNYVSFDVAKRYGENTIKYLEIASGK